MTAPTPSLSWYALLPVGAVPTIGCQIISNPPLPIFCGGGGPVQMPQRALHRLPSSRILSERSIRHGALSLS